jgi:hypothetical protein
MPSHLSIQVPRQVCIAKDQRLLEQCRHWEGKKRETAQLGLGYSVRQGTQPSGPQGAVFSLFVGYINHARHMYHVSYNSHPILRLQFGLLDLSSSLQFNPMGGDY